MKYKVLRNKYTTDEDKKSQIHSQIKIHLMNITKIVKCKRKYQFYDGAQNRHTKYKN